MIPIKKDGKIVGMVNGNFLVEFTNKITIDQMFLLLGANTLIKVLDVDLTMPDEHYVKSAQILGWDLDDR